MRMMNRLVQRGGLTRRWANYCSYLNEMAAATGEIEG